VRSEDIKLGQDKLDYDSLSHIRPGYVMIGPVSSGYVIMVKPV